MVAMLSFLVHTKKIYDSQLLSVLSLEDLPGAGGRRITPHACCTLMYRENSYMESFRKKNPGKFTGEDKLSYEKARYHTGGFPSGTSGKEPAANAGRHKR